MLWIWLTAGMLAKIIHISLHNFKKSDLYAILFAIGMGFLMMWGIAMDEQSGLLDPWFGMPVGFALVIVFAFKDRLLPVITEGTLFGYSLVAGYLFFSSIYTNETRVGNLSLLLMLLSLAVTFFLILYPHEVGEVAQTAAMTLFICVSIYIGYKLSKDTLFLTGSSWELVVIGYSYLTLIANVLYVFYFIPIPSKGQSFTDRMRDIREHARELDQKYISVNSTPKQIMLTLILFFVMLLLGHLNYVSDMLLVPVVLSFMVLVHTPPEKNKLAYFGYYKKE